MSGTHLFGSWMLAGFECSSQRRADGRRLDLVTATRHDTLANRDYSTLASLGVQVVRDGLRWHRIEQGGSRDWSTFLPMLRASERSGVRVIWDLCHYGVPDDVDVWSPRFPERFGAFAGAVARVVRDECALPGLYCPVNEPSFWAWAAGDKALFHPLARGRGWELKRQLARAAIAAIEAVRGVEPRARFVHVDPLVHVAAHPGRPQDIGAAEWTRQLMYQAWDMISGRLEPELGGRPEHLDVVGLNYYWDNQWILEGPPIGIGHECHRPLTELLREVWERYHRPLLLAETGAEGDNGPAWLRHVCAEVREAIAAGVWVGGVCVYPVLDYPGWENERHCRCGVLSAEADWTTRGVRAAMAAEVVRQEALFREPEIADQMVRASG